MIAALLLACAGERGDSAEALPLVDVTPAAFFARLRLPECEHGSGSWDYPIGTVEITSRDGHLLAIDAERTVYPLDEADYDPVYDHTFLAVSFTEEVHEILAPGDSLSLDVYALAFCRGGVPLEVAEQYALEVLADGEPLAIVVTIEAVPQ